MKYLFLPNIFEYANRVRGGGNKLGGLLMMIGAWIGYFALVHDWYTRPWQVSVLHFSLVVVAIAVAVLVIFKWIWGSKYWDNDIDTTGEDGLIIAENHAAKYAAPNSKVWKNYAFDYLKKFSHTLGFCIVGVALLNPVIPYIGWRYGQRIADIYQEEFFTLHDHKTIERSEHRTGYLFGHMVQKSALVVLIQTLITVGVWAYG